MLIANMGYKNTTSKSILIAILTYFIFTLLIMYSFSLKN